MVNMPQILLCGLWFFQSSKWLGVPLSWLAAIQGIKSLRPLTRDLQVEQATQADSQVRPLVPRPCLCLTEAMGVYSWWEGVSPRADSHICEARN